jgi:hypothetical protein
MTPVEANVLLTKAALLDPRMKRVNLVEQADMATAWSEVLEDVSLEGALRVLPLHYRRTDTPLTPAAVVDLLDDLTAHMPPNLTQQRLQALRDGLTAAGVTREEYEAARARLTDAELVAWLPASVRALEGGAA